MEKQGPRVLLVDGDESTRQFLSVELPQAGYSIHTVRSGKDGLQTFQLFRPDLILLDLGLPDMDGREFILRLQSRTIPPIIVISVRDEESEKVSALNTGAHDYLTKPFATAELLARMRAALRSVCATQDGVFILDDLRVDLGRREVFVFGNPVKLTATEYDLLTVLVHHAGKVRTHHQLIHDLWSGTQYQDVVHLLRVTISHLRHKLQQGPMQLDYIVTESGVGYRLRSETSDHSGTERQAS